MSGPPEVSVVVPTFRRETRLAFALEGLAQQTLGRDRFEVIVVRAEGGLDGELVAAPQGLSARFLVSPRAGAAAQRNVGWRAARAPLVAFTDDDCRPTRAWLERLVEAHDGPETAIQGRTEPDPDEAHLNWGLARSIEVVGPNGWYQTCNISYPRALLERVGGFDERFPGAYGEDTDLARRALEAGARIVYVDGAVVWHAVHPRPLSRAIREARRREVVPIVVKRHPSHREQLYLRIFFDWRHGKLALALAATPLWRSRPLLAALAALPYLENNVDWRHSRRRLARNLLHVPARLSVDLAELVVVAGSAARHRVLVL